ncbi:MAG: ABC transporter substrate-binding protein [Lachnospirales bacterium]
MNFKKKIGAFVLSSMMLLSACGQPSEENSTEVEGSTAVKYKELLNIAMTAQPPTLDATLTPSNAANNVAGNIFEQLYTMNENYEPTPELAEAVEVSDDGLTYTFTLRSGVKFHNGKEMMAGDVVASMNRWLKVSTRASTLLPNASFEKIDDLNVKLTVEKATSDVLTIISTRMLFPAIMPKEVVDSAPPEGLTEYIGTGPYKMGEWKQDQYIHLVRNDDYQTLDTAASAYSGSKGIPTKDLYYMFVSEHATRIAGIKTGEYDVAEDIPLENYKELSEEEDIKLHSRSSGSLNAFLNTTEGVLGTNPKMRQAILAAMNCEEMLMASYTDSAYYVLDPGFMNVNQPQWAVKNGNEYYNQNNPEKSKELLKEAGYNGEKVTLLTTKDYQEMYAATIVLQEQLRQVGINAEVLNLDFPSFMETKSDLGKWDIFITSNSYNVIPPQILAVNPQWAGFSEPEVSEYLNKIRIAPSKEEAQEEWANLQQFIYEFGAATAIGHYKSAMATTDKVENFVYFDHPIYWNAKVAE